jgi:alpha-maltose-1-phosphate synthase
LNVLLAHPGTQHALTLARQLHTRGLLHEFWTCFAISSRLARFIPILPSSLGQKLENRVVPELGRELRTVPLLEFRALRRLARGGNPEAVMLERNQRFQQAISQRSIESADAVIGFDTSSWLLAERAKNRGKIFVLDQTTVHPNKARAVAEHLRSQFPEWSETIPPRIERVRENQELEHQLADVIVVASSFAREALIANGVAPEKIRLNPYGVNLAEFLPREMSGPKRPLRFIFVGSVSARKGAPLLLTAWDKLQARDAELWLLGGISPKAHKLLPNARGLEIPGRKSRAEISAMLGAGDVFVFPSYAEGFGLVILEAMASGLPVITTTATAGPDLITQNQEGWILDPGDLDGLVETMRFCLSHRDRVAEMGANARRAAERFTWDAYGDRWAEILREVGGRKRG